MIFGRFLVFFLLVLFSCGPSYTIVQSESCNVTVCFSPYQKCSLRIVDLINTSTRSVDVAVYDFTNRKLARALVDAFSRGVSVRVIVDARKARSPHSRVSMLVDSGIKVRVKKGSGGGLMHNKFAVIDGLYVVTGSFNWTVSAQIRNDENLLLIASPELARVYEKQFNRLWMLAGMEE